jgi:glycosyltransferase involved in cell wall biosynthesis
MPDGVPKGPIRLTNLISGLGVGGAEMMLYGLSAALRRDGFEIRVISMTGDGPMGERIRGAGIPVTSLGMERGVPNVRGAMRLARLLRGDPPDVLQTWMYHADLLGAIGARRGGRVPLVWGIHNTALERRATKALTRWVVRLNSALSNRLPDAIVCCSEEARRAHARLGYDPGKMQVIPNGIDLALFRPDGEARRAVRDELGLAPAAILIGMAARYHPQKDHLSFIEAAARIARPAREAHFILCGDQIASENAELQRMVESAGLGDRLHLLGVREDMPRIMASLDLAVLSSAYAEAFPLVIGEAMACEVPCVVTDVGDSAAIVGDTGAVVPPRDPGALAGMCLRLLEGGERRLRELGTAARLRIEERYSLARAVEQYAALYRKLAGRA